MSLMEKFKAIHEKIVIEYKTLFKGGVVLMGVSLAGMVQTFPELSKLGSEARKLQFEVEEKNGVSNIKELNCEKLSEGRANCNYAKFKYYENESAMKFTTGTIVVLFYTGLGLTVISFYSFLESVKEKS